MSTALPTFDELYALAKAEVIARQPLLTDWEPGSDLDALAGMGSMLADQVIRICVDLFASRFVATAIDSDLDAVVVDLYPDLTRVAASGARGTLTFGRGTNVGAVGIPEGTTCTGVGSDGVTYTYATTEAGSIAALDSTADIPARCSTTGPAGRIAETSIDTITSSIPDDVEGDVTVTNAARFVGGADEETDDAYRARAQRYPTTLARGTVAALEVAALATPGVAYVTVYEGTGSALGYVYVYVADADGRGNAALAADAQTLVDAVRAAGVSVEVLASTRELVDLTVTVTVAHGKGTAALQAIIASAVLAYTDSVAPGARLYLSAAAAAAIGASVDVKGATATSTATTGDYVEPSAVQDAVRVASGDLTVTLVEL